MCGPKRLTKSNILYHIYEVHEGRCAPPRAAQLSPAVTVTATSAN